MRRTTWRRCVAAVLFLFAACATAPEKRSSAGADRSVIIVVWDGLRPDTIDATMTLGKNGAAYLQDRKRGGMILDERTVFPLALAKELQAAGIALPATTTNGYAPGEIVLSPTNGNPTEFKPPKRLSDGASSDPT